MKEEIIYITKDKVYLKFFYVALFFSLVSYYLFWRLLVKNAGNWLAPLFIPIHLYVIVIFVLNFISSLVSYKRDRFLSLAFNFLTAAVNILLLLALILNLENPNG